MDHSITGPNFSAKLDHFIQKENIFITFRLMDHSKTGCICPVINVLLERKIKKHAEKTARQASK
jgi:hypothetical protein